MIKISIENSNESPSKRSKSRHTRTAVGKSSRTAVGAHARDSAVRTVFYADDEQLDDDVQRDTNQSALEKEYYDVVAAAAQWLQTADDDQQPTHDMIYDHCEWWNVSGSWDDRLYYKAYGQWCWDDSHTTPIKTTSKEAKKSKSKKKKKSKKRKTIEISDTSQDADDHDDQDQDQGADDLLAGAGNQFFVHQQAIMLAIAKKTVAGCAPESILKAEICAMVCDDSDVWQAAVYDDQVFDSAWLAAVGTGDSVGTGVSIDSSRDTAHRLSFSPHQQTEFRDVQGNSDVQQGPMSRPVSILKKSTDDTEQQQQ